MGKKTKEELIEEILSALNKKKNTINEIANHIGSNWTTVRETLDLLEKYGLVGYRTEKNVKTYFRKKGREETENEDHESYFNLPLTEKQKEIAHSLLGTVQQEYKRRKGKNPGKIVMQKIAEDVNIKSDLDLPSGWYLFGITSVVCYDPSKEYPENTELIGGKIKKEVSSVVDEYLRLKTIEDVMIHQYRKHGKKLYIAKLSLSKLGHMGVNLQDRETKQAVQEYLSDFLLYLPKGKYSEEVQDVVNRYVLTMNKLLLGKENLNKIKQYLCVAFNAVWEYVAAFHFYNDLLEYYDPAELLPVKEKMSNAKRDAIEQIEFISEYYSPKKKPPELKIKTPAEKLIRDTFIEISKENT